MAKFNAVEVANFINSVEFVQFEYQVRGKVSARFGVTAPTAAKWVERVIGLGLVNRDGL